jgi:hypothetical protein
MTRQDRQREEISSAFEQGRLTRALELALEHLVDFPDDTQARSIAQRASRLLERLPREPS